MTAFNVVKFKVKSGSEAAFLAAHDGGKAKWPGLLKANIIKTGEGSYCLIGEWANSDAITAARPEMIETLNSFRSLLDDQGDGKGITDAMSGEVALAIV